MCRRCGKAESELDGPCVEWIVGKPAKMEAPNDLGDKFVKYIDDSNPQDALAEVMDGTPVKHDCRESEDNFGENQVTAFIPSPSKLAASIATVGRRHDNDYPLWQGPCGAGPLGGITQSMLSRFISCRDRFRLKYVLGLETYDKWNHRMGYGNMWHACEEAHAKNSHTWEGRLIDHFNEQLRLYPMQREEIVKWFNVCCVQFPEYVKYWSQHPDVLNRTPLMQEQVFDVPYKLPSGRTVRLRGKFDSVDLISDVMDDRGDGVGYQNTPSGIYVQENKSKGDIEKSQIERQLKFDLQTMLYLIALHAAPLSIYGDNLDKAWNGTPICGVRYNVVRRPLSGGEGMIVQKKGSKNIPAETEEAYYARVRQVIDGTGINSKGDLYTGPSHWFFRVRAEVSAKDIQVFRETCLDPLLEQLCWWYEEITIGEGLHSYGVPPMNYRTPFGIWSALEEGGSTEYDAFLENGSEAGLRRVETLFPELQ